MRGEDQRLRHGLARQQPATAPSATHTSAAPTTGISEQSSPIATPHATGAGRPIAQNVTPPMVP